MTLQEWAFIAEMIASFAVVVSLIYLAIQVRESTKVNSAQARHSISEFVLQIGLFNAEHADRLARVHGDGELSEGDHLFRYWNHLMVMLHAETYFHHQELGLMPASHWNGYVRFITGYTKTPGFRGAWADVGPAFSENFARWMDDRLAEQDRNAE